MSFKILFQIFQNMGHRYVLFRIWHELKKRVGLLEIKFPTKYKNKPLLSLEEWKAKPSLFFFESSEELLFDQNPTEGLKDLAEDSIKGKFLFFSSTPIQINFKDTQKWHRNYDNGVAFPQIHWAKIQDFSLKYGDIKYVWELSRFSFLNTLIRYDYHFGKDQSKFIFGLIDDWIENNPLNIGPNYKCSQEISIRLFNWIFALHYYKNSTNLSPSLFNKILNSINQQYQHVYANINFSRIAVRNNHAIAESMCLFLVGKLLPFLDNAEKISKNGQKWFEEEIDYQIYDDGTFLQFSMNYHRVVVQLLSWAIALSNKNKWVLNPLVVDKAKKSISFLFACLNTESGHLPNYGANDGALFFPLNNCEYRDNRAQINALNYAIEGVVLFNEENTLEDTKWVFNQKEVSLIKKDNSGIHRFDIGGYYIYNDPLDNTKTFIRCGSHKDRPSHADNLHLDIWDDKENILRDAGSYKYNTDAKYSEFFTGTASHNTVMLGDNNQMKKGNRFIWLNWTQAVRAEIKENDGEVVFEGEVQAFTFLQKEIVHKRVWKKLKGFKKWEVKDIIMHNTDLSIQQVWNVSPYFQSNYHLSFDKDIVQMSTKEGWYSGLYGAKELTQRIVLTTQDKSIITEIKAL